MATEYSISDLPDRIASKIRINEESGCWEWISGLDGRGYGQVRVKDKHHRAHRVVYELLAGPIPAGLHIDHLCRNKICVNPHHLEPVSNRENILRGFSPSALHARKTHCINGHEFNSENTYLYPDRKHHPRVCKICYLKTAKAHRERKRLKNCGGEGEN